MRTVISALWTAHIAMDNCTRAGNTEWQTGWQVFIDTVEKRYLPCGSGFDTGTKIAYWRRKRPVMCFDTAFHHMNGDGYYTCWTEHKVIVTPTFEGIDIRVTGRDRNGIKDYIAETFHAALTAKLPDDIYP